MSAVALALLLFAVGCEDSSAEREPASDESSEIHESAAPRTLFPLTPGDRWRLRAGDGTHRLEGVTAVDTAGIAAIHGTGHARPERYAFDDEEVRLVTPQGVRLSPVVRAPLRAGARHTYELTERDVAITCEVEVVRVQETHTVAGVELVGCVSQTRRCAYPAGAPFPTETTHTREETYCPGVGLILERNVLRPPPTRSSIGADRSEAVVGFRVSTGRASAAQGCARYILLPSDVAAACGPDARPDEAPQSATGAELPSGACRYGYRHGVAALELVIGAPRAEAPSDALTTATDGDRAAWMSGPREGCPTAARLAPLLRSLLGG